MDKNCPKYVELIQRSVKLLLLHLRVVGHAYYSPTLMKHGKTQINFILFLLWFVIQANYEILPENKVTAAIIEHLLIVSPFSICHEDSQNTYCP
jgi:hypothetical protein